MPVPLDVLALKVEEFLPYFEKAGSIKFCEFNFFYNLSSNELALSKNNLKRLANLDGVEIERY